MFGKCPAKKAFSEECVIPVSFTPHGAEELVGCAGRCWGAVYGLTAKPGCLQVASGCYSRTRQTLAGISKNWNVFITYFATLISFMYLISHVILKQIPCCHSASVSLLVPGLLPHLPHKGTCCNTSSAEGSRHPWSTSNQQHRENPSNFPSL